MKMKFTDHTRLFLGISGAIIVIALIMQVCGAGLNLGVDFTGGSILKYSVGEDYDVKDVQTILASVGCGDAEITKTAPSSASKTLQEQLQSEATVEPTAEATEEAAAEPTAEATAEAAEEVSAEATAEATEEAAAEATAEATEEAAAEATEETTEETTAEAESTAESALLNTDKSGIAADGLTDLQIRLSLTDEESATDSVRTVLEQEMRAKYPNFLLVSIDHASAISGRSLLGNAVKALLIALVCILIYIVIRFNLTFGLTALATLVHNVLIMIAFMVFFRGAFQVNAPFVAAVMAVVGYSMINTIILFDRIRETAKQPEFAKKSKKEIVEASVSTALSRMINITVIALIAMVALFVFGVGSVRECAFPLIVGILAGFYSSVLLSGQVWAIWSAKAADRKNAAKIEKK